MAKHNKKRNVGLLYEQLMRFASNCILEKNQTRAKLAINILCEHFKPGTALYKEFRLFNALVDSKVSNKDVARRIIEESRKACLSHDKNQLRKEKSLLIKEINHSLDCSDFYNQKSKKYRTFATVQALLNEWRGASNLGPAEIVKYESVLEDWLTRPESPASSIKKEHANPLTLNIMVDKFRAKYEDRMNPDQRSLFESYLLNKDDVAHKVERIKERADKALTKYFTFCENKVLIEKKSLVEDKIKKLGVGSTSDIVSRALVLSDLTYEMEGNDV